MIAPADKKRPESYTVKILRQAGPEAGSRWDAFSVPYRPGDNVISALQWIATNPKTTAGKDVEPPVWESACLEEVCGSCTMLANGRVRQVCAVLIDELLDEAGEKGHADEITLAPMTKFPVVRDLVVDRSRMFEALKKLKAWVPIDGTHDLGPGPEEEPDKQAERYALSRCMTCGCCLEACPQYTKDNNFIGANAIGQALYFNEHDTGKALKADRLEVLMGPGGINDCGNAQNCVKVCPKNIPLTEAIAKVGRQATVYAVKKFFTGK